MRVLSKREKDLFARLMVLAGGDFGRVEDAIRRSSSETGSVRIKDVEDLLKAQRTGARPKEFAEDLADSVA